MLRTHLFTKLGGPSQTISALEEAFKDGASVTAKVLWLPKNTTAGERGRGPAEAKSRYIRCTPLLGSDDRVGVWMVILVPVDSEHRHNGYGRNDHEMVDSTAEDRRRLGMMSKATSIRGTSSIDGESDSGFRLTRKGRSNTVRKGRGDNDDPYAEYLRSSSSTGGSRDGIIRARKNSIAMER